MELSSLRKLVTRRNTTIVVALLTFTTFVVMAADIHLPGVINIPTSLSIGTTADPSSKSVLDMVSTTKGFLPPRMTTTQQNNISSVPEALSIYDTVLHRPAYYSGSAWLSVASLSGAETLTNKTMSGSSNTFTNIPLASAVTGTLPAASLPNPSASTLGGIQSYVAVSNQWINAISTSGVPSSTQPTFSNISGTNVVASGGTGLASTTAYAVLAGGTTSTGNFQQVSGLGSSGQVLTSNGASALPTWQAGGGTLTSMTIQKLTSGTAATYTRPTSPTPIYLVIRVVGGGGGGAGGGVDGGNGSSGGDTTFGTTLLVAKKGGGGSSNPSGGYGGVTTGGSSLGAATGYIASGYGGPGGNNGSGGGQGGNSAFFGGGGSGGAVGGAGSASDGYANSGGGGGGGAASSLTTIPSGGGGGPGGCLYAVITSPSSTYTYTIGAGGGAGSAGTSATAGAAGGTGFIIVEEHYQ